jgi:hypothetical protein
MKALNNSRPVRRCKYINAKGNVCHRPAMRGSSNCYVHLEDPALQLRNDDYKTDFELPAIEDSASIQIAVNRVLTAPSAGEIRRRHAALYLYGLQIARQNAKQRRSAGNGKAEKRAE